jgi:hypothetical protein
MGVKVIIGILNFSVRTVTDDVPDNHILQSCEAVNLVAVSFRLMAISFTSVI